MRATQTLVTSVLNRLAFRTDRSRGLRWTLALLLVAVGFATPVPPRGMSARAEENPPSITMQAPFVNEITENSFQWVFVGQLSDVANPSQYTASLSGPGDLVGTGTINEGGSFEIVIESSQNYSPGTVDVSAAGLTVSFSYSP